MDVGVDYNQDPTPGEKVPKRPSRKDRAKEQLHDAAKNQVKRTAGQVVKQAALVAARAAATAITTFLAAYGWPILIFLLVIAILLFIFSAAFGGGLISTAFNGYFGKTYPHEAGTANANVQKILQLASTPSRVIGFSKIEFSSDKDRQYVADGKIDDRLARALTYLASQHEMIRISHIISDYEYMNLAEAGTDTDPRIIKNISAHKDGLAADIDQLDFVYKIIQFNPECQAGTAGTVGSLLGIDEIAGIGTGDSDIIYYNDKNDELLRLKCHASIAEIALGTNTTWKDQPAEGIPIKIADQDCKPNIQHAGNLPDPCTTITDPIEKLIYEKVSQPEARRKTHASIREMLTFPTTTEDINHYKVTQLITFSDSRDVQPFQDDGTLDKLYGKTRPANYGLFWLLESWQNIHIAY